MSTSIALISIHRVPCALQHYLRQLDPKAPSHSLSQGERQVAFQHWVAYIRGGDTGYPSHVTAEEHLRCPLLWCRERFDNLASTLQHVSECPWLSNAWYWCPYCCRPESFLVSEKPFADPAQHTIQRKSSKLRRAVTFFKHLGLKSCSRHKTSGSSSACEAESHDTWLAKLRRSEMEDTSHEISSCTELADNSNDAHRRGSHIEKYAKILYEMEGTTINFPQRPDYLPRCTRETDSLYQPYELDVEPLTRESDPIRETISPTISLTGIGAQFEAASHDVEPKEEMLVSPASTVESPFNHSGAKSIKSPYAKSPSPGPAYNDPNTISLPEVDVALPHNRSLLPSINDGSFHDGTKLSTQSQVEEFRVTVRVLNEEWLRRCQSIPDLAQCTSALTPQSALDEGTQTLQLIFQGVLPWTFNAVFALAHIACAAAYVIHRDDSSHCWNEFFQHIRNLHTLIKNGNDARLFVQLVNLLWWPQGSSAQRFCSNYLAGENIGALDPLRRPVVGHNEFSSAGLTESQAPRYPTKSASMKALDSLKDGPVVQECSRFLDGLEYAGISERSKVYPTPTSIEEMSKTIIHPLQHRDGIEALREAINTTAIELSSGSLRSVRDVEVSLISNGKSYCLSSTIYKKYLDAVTSICDHYMHGAGPNWRDPYYATDLNVVLASAVESDNRQRRDQCHRRYTDVNAIPNNTQAWPQSTPNPSSIETQTLTGSSLSAVTSPTFTGDYSPASQPGSSASPQSSFSAPTPSSSRTDPARCPLCPALFTGSARDRNSNLKRHMRTKRDHGNVVGFQCTLCGRIISRSDNLGKHMRTVHEGDTGAVLLRRVGAKKRRRNTEGAE